MSTIFNGFQCLNKVCFGLTILTQSSMVTIQTLEEQIMGLHTNLRLIPPCNSQRYLIQEQVLSIFQKVLHKTLCTEF
jgi:hypothetical protein